MGHYQVNMGGGGRCNIRACSVLYKALWRVSIFDRAGGGADFDTQVY